MLWRAHRGERHRRHRAEVRLSRLEWPLDRAAALGNGRRTREPGCAGAGANGRLCQRLLRRVSRRRGRGRHDGERGALASCVRARVRRPACWSARRRHERQPPPQRARRRSLGDRWQLRCLRLGADRLDGGARCGRAGTGRRRAALSAVRAPVGEQPSGGCAAAWHADCGTGNGAFILPSPMSPLAHATAQPGWLRVLLERGSTAAQRRC
mmetsp:Transcript_7964/g.20446  ORF Transcript_7964/g.20446 Transcript_7964/m.20446 type:complete len:210 (+) Transcript_7964:259-888(+)